MSRFLSYQISDTGFDYTIKYTSKTIKEFIGPFIENLSREFGESTNRPYIVGISGPPGCGKSSFSALFKVLLKKEGVSSYILPLDGFHYKNEDLSKRTVSVNNRTLFLNEKKGAKETYDTQKLLLYMKKLREQKDFYWPLYLRTIHDPFEEGIFLCNWNSLFILEGNYLFIKTPPWKDLKSYFHKKIFILPKKQFLKKRLITRKCLGGYSKKNARKHFKCTDSPNIEEVLGNSGGYNYLIEQRGKYSFQLKYIHSSI